MTYMAIIINIAAMGGFSLFLLIKGISSPIVFIIFFGGMAIFNLLLWGIRKGQIKWKQRANAGVERRSFFRVVYAPDRRPRLHIANKNYKILDISQKGVRIINDRNEILSQPIQGTITFTDGEAVDITGNIGWKKANEISLLLEELIPHTTISKELGHIAPP